MPTVDGGGHLCRSLLEIRELSFQIVVAGNNNIN